MFVGTLRVDVLLGDVHSLKQKRALVRPIVTELRKFDVAVAETDHQDLHRRVEIGVACVSGDAAQVRRVLDTCERVVAERPDIEVLSVRQRLFDEEDE
ncbi:MAG TPA: DUF503 domain-containing protein [Actinomycetes bacterium]|nr:DUF503 domain-containing protein [Actinomycetes bacterium]